MTMTEMLIVVSLVAILAMIAIPRLGYAIKRANESATKGKLEAVRGALLIYFGDNGGNYPPDLTPLLQPGSKYLTGIIPIYTAEHGNTSSIFYVPDIDPAADTGGWGYVASGPHMGSLWVQCTHTSTEGRVWSTY